MSNISERIRKLLDDQTLESYSRYDSEHPFDIYLGIDQQGRKSLALVMMAKPERISSSKTISVQFFKRDDGRLMLSFALEDGRLKDIFYKFCEDIIESTRLSEQEDGFSTVIQRWDTWIKFFSRTVLPLSESEIMGLIGELYFLKNIMIKSYGANLALESFIGTDKAHKDFEIHDTWYEVKSIHSGVRSVKISSIEQLDSHNRGNLEVITFDQGTANSEGNITLNGIVNDLKQSLDSKNQIILDEKLRKANYIGDVRYDEYNYIFKKIDEYDVAEDFPKISKKSLPQGISKASYEIDISAIERFKN